jgi:hypothetical protein
MTDFSSHPDRFKPNPDFLRERAAAGEPISALRRVFPQAIWPAEWAEIGENAATSAESAPQYPPSAPRATVGDQPLDEISEDDIPF